MCGIAGILGFNGIERQIDEVTSRMARQLVHRGPDDQGIWIDSHAGIALVHRRLSVVDLSPHGRQPMASHDGRFVITFNGEIYNHVALRKELDGASNEIRWRGQSDTETFLEAIGYWGLEDALRRAVGMFAFGLWDRQKRSLHLVRDRLGEKPLYYGRAGQSLVFGSELKTLSAHPLWSGEIDRDAVALLMRHSYVPSPYSIYSHVAKLPPATIVTLSADSIHGSPEPKRYWSAFAAASNGSADAETAEPEAVAERLEEQLRNSVRLQIQADVPLGAFLSGGVDSSTLVALMQAEAPSRVKTFSIGFHEDEYDEAKYAKRVAEHLGTDHTELYVTPEEAMAAIPLLPGIYDEPFADSSQIPTYLVSRLARNHVTVSLSGDGGDELFGGYNRYFWGRDLWQFFRLTPRPFRSLVAKSIEGLSPTSWDHLYHSTRLGKPAGERQRLFGDKLYKLAEVVRAATPEDVYRSLTSHWKQPNEVVIGGTEPRQGEASSIVDLVVGDPTLRMMLLDTVTYLPDDILVKLDRASMAVSLESRAPFLDHRLVEYAWQIPLPMKIQGSIGKAILRKVLYKHVPRALIERPKQGFAVPIDSWLRGPLREWGEALLSEQRLRRDGLLDVRAVRKKWSEHLSGRRNWQYLLWCVLMLQQWLDIHPTGLAKAGSPMAVAA